MFDIIAVDKGVYLLIAQLDTIFDRAIYKIFKFNINKSQLIICNNRSIPKMPPPKNGQRKTTIPKKKQIVYEYPQELLAIEKKYEGINAFIKSIRNDQNKSQLKQKLGCKQFILNGYKVSDKIIYDAKSESKEQLHCKLKTSEQKTFSILSLKQTQTSRYVD